MNDHGALPTFATRTGPIATRIVRPVQRFMHVEAGGGIVLLAATVLALVWANSPWKESYFDLWHTSIELKIGDLLLLEEPLEAWVNDALMAIFFFVVGLEIKRELVTGELRDRRAAILPGVAALGGMVLPALVYVALNVGGEGADGWGIPMATDIAFALGVVALLGSRVPAPLKIFLLTLAIVDDIGAITVIAIFYTEDLSLGWLAIGAGLLAFTYVVRRVHVWYLPVYVILGVLVWVAIFKSGVHATIAGVALGLITPAEPLNRDLDIGTVDDIVNDERIPPVERATEAAKIVTESAPVGERLERALHPWSTYFVIPVFALANAGIVISRDVLSDALTSPITIGIFLGLVVGKLVGVFGATMLAARFGMARLPPGTRAGHVGGIASVAGIGFTVALFITALAFDDLALRDEAKIGVLAGSVVAAALGVAILSLQKPSATSEDDDTADVVPQP